MKPEELREIVASTFEKMCREDKILQDVIKKFVERISYAVSQFKGLLGRKEMLDAIETISKAEESCGLAELVSKDPIISKYLQPTEIEFIEKEISRLWSMFKRNISIKILDKYGIE